MLDLLYIGLVVLPLTIAAVALLLLAWRSIRGHHDRRELQRRDPRDVRAVGRAVLESLAPEPEPEPEPAAAPERMSLVDLSAMVESLAFPPRDERPIVREPPAAPIGAPQAATKRCPDCAEEVLAAARVCKHCRYRFDEPDYRSLSA